MIAALTALGAIASVLGAWWGYVSWKNTATERKEQAARSKLEKLDLPPVMFAQIEVHELLDLEKALEFLERRRIEARESYATVPSVVLLLFQPNDRDRYSREWTAHLCQLIAEGEIKRAKRDRRRLAGAAVLIAIGTRVRRAVGRVR
jgi:hypothetical protein